jgi:lauroyl/myristoyl acyltransferase
LEREEIKKEKEKKIIEEIERKYVCPMMEDTTYSDGGDSSNRHRLEKKDIPTYVERREERGRGMVYTSQHLGSIQMKAVYVASC